MVNVDLARFEAEGGKRMLGDRMAEAVARGTYELPRKSGSAHPMVWPDCVATVAVRVAHVDVRDPWKLSSAEAEGRRQAFVYEAFFRDCVAGFENANLSNLSTQIGLRETRRVYGDYRLTREDCLAARRFDDCVLICGSPLEDHRATEPGSSETAWAYLPGNRAYDVPYRTLVPRAKDNLWVAGRCFSATHDAHASCRSMGQTMAMGQAAGLAADLSLETERGASDISVSLLQEKLRRLGAVLEEPMHAATTDKWGWRENRRPR
jgi:hypothetical protein